MLKINTVRDSGKPILYRKALIYSLVNNYFKEFFKIYFPDFLNEINQIQIQTIHTNQTLEVLILSQRIQLLTWLKLNPELKMFLNQKLTAHRLLQINSVTYNFKLI